MKTREKVLPNWIVKNIKFGQENENVSSIVVGVLALYIVGVIGLFVSKPFGGEDLWAEVGIAICVLAVIVALGFILVARVALLEKKRVNAVKAYKKAKSEVEKAMRDKEKAVTEKEKSEAEERKAKAERRKAIWQVQLDTLYVKLEEAA